jgi:hypothetical protein
MWQRTRSVLGANRNMILANDEKGADIYTCKQGNNIMIRVSNTSFGIY